MSSPPRIMYIHGLEGSPTGSKAQAISKEFTLLTPDMHMSVWDIRKSNSIIRNLLEEQGIYWGSGLTMGGLAGGWVGGMVAGAVLVGYSMLCRQRIVRQAVERSFECCMEEQEKAIREFKPTLIVGSSWGGAIVLELIRRGVWGGKTIALCPAYTKVHSILLTEDTKLPEGLKECLVVHGTKDETIPYRHSEELVKNHPGLELLTIEGDNHRLDGMLESGQLIQVIKERLE